MQHLGLETHSLIYNGGECDRLEVMPLILQCDVTLSLKSYQGSRLDLGI